MENYTNSVLDGLYCTDTGNNTISLSEICNTYYSHEYTIEKINNYPKLDTKLTIDEQKNLIDLDLMNILLFRDHLSDELLNYVCEHEKFILYLYRQLDEIDINFLIRNITKNPCSLQYIYIKPNKYVDNEELKEIAIRRDGSVIKFLKDPSDYLINLAVNQSCYSIFFIEDPSIELQCKAIKSAIKNNIETKYFLRRLTLTEKIFSDNNILLELDDEIIKLYFEVFFIQIDPESNESDRYSNYLNSIFFLPSLGKISIENINKHSRLKKIFELVKMEMKLRK